MLIERIASYDDVTFGTTISLQLTAILGRLLLMNLWTDTMTDDPQSGAAHSDLSVAGAAVYQCLCPRRNSTRRKITAIIQIERGQTRGAKQAESDPVHISTGPHHLNGSFVVAPSGLICAASFSLPGGVLDKEPLSTYFYYRS